MKLFKYMAFALLLATLAGKAHAQTKVLSGKVTEMFGRQAEPIIGVNVSIRNSQNRSVGGAVTDVNGLYNVTIPDESDLTIVFSYIGMKTERVKYTGQKRLDMTLEDATQAMNEVVVQAERVERSALGITARQQVSATQKVDMEELVAIAPVTSIEDALQGQLGGVDIVLGGGDPGARASIQIRGTSTLNANADPLIVIDGIPYPADIQGGDFDFSDLNNDDLGALLNISPQDIQSIEVLKDAASTAIWGTKGANGVLIINTKHGSVGKTRFSFSTKFAAKFEPEGIPMLNGSQYTSMLGDALWNAANYVGANTTTGESYLNLLFQQKEIGYDQNWEYFDEYNQDTDWLDLIKRNTSSWDNTFSMSGGGEKATYRFSLGYLTEGGTTIGTSFDRFSSNLQISYHFSEKLRFDANVAFTQSDRDANYSNIRTEAFRKMPNKSPYYIDDRTGGYTGQYFSHTENSAIDPKASADNNYNPVAMGKEGQNETLQRESRMNFNVEYKILPSLTYQGYVSMTIRNIKNRMFLPEIATNLPWTDTSSNRSTDAVSDQLTIATENKLMWIKNWNQRHNIVATAIWRTEETNKSSYGTTTYGNPSADLSDPVTGSAIAAVTQSADSKDRTLSGTFAANYTFLNRYVFNATVTTEGRASMGKSERWGTFPSGGVAWHVQDEPFMKNLKWLNQLKLRFSVGQSGKAASGTGVYLGTYGTGDNYMDMWSIRPHSMQLNKLKWETTTEYNTGADISLFDNRLGFTVDVYQKYTKDLLQSNVTIPSSTGIPGYARLRYYNSGEMTNKGWEFRTDFVAVQKKDLRVAGYLNISHNENKITTMPDNYVPENYNFGNGNYAYRYEEGRPLGSYYGYRYLGVYADKDATYARDAEGNIMKDLEGNSIIMKNGTAQVCPGDAIYEDINHDGVINEYDIVYLGNGNPRITGGFGVNVTYKQFKLSTNFYGRYGQDVVNRARMNNEAMYGPDNQSTAVLRRWRKEGDITDIPRALWHQGFNYLGSDRFVEEASYLRLKNISLTYSLPQKLCQKWGLNKCDFYVTGYNLFTWTKYTGQEPEVAPKNTVTEDTALTPCSIQFVCGVNLSF